MAKALKKTNKEKNPGLAKLPKEVRNKMGYMAEGAEMPAPVDKYKRQRRKRARRARKGKHQKGSKGCYKGKYGMICPGDPGYDSTVTVAAEGAMIPGGDRKRRKRARALKKQRKRRIKGRCRGGNCSFKHGGKMGSCGC